MKVFHFDGSVSSCRRLKPMKSPLHCLITLFTISTLFTTRVFAGGSVSFEDQAVPLLKTQPSLLQFVQQSLDVAPVGVGIRLGKDFGDLAGKRITPFSFEARPKGAAGPFTLLLIVNSTEGMNDNNESAVTIEIRQLRNPSSKRP
jgi:hypothetical protein